MAHRLWCTVSLVLQMHIAQFLSLIAAAHAQVQRLSMISEILIPARIHPKRSRVPTINPVLPMPSVSSTPKRSVRIAAYKALSQSSDFSEFNLPNTIANPIRRKRKKEKKLSQLSGAPEMIQNSSEPFATKRCSHCQVTKTPQWRGGPMGPKTLCNACGVRCRSGRLLPEYRPAVSPTFVPSLHSNSHRKIIEMRNQAIQDVAVSETKPQMSQPHKAMDERKPPSSPTQKAIHEAAMAEIEPLMSPPLKKKKLSGATEMMQNSSPQPVATKRCSHCEVTKTPEWREGPMGPKTICNACGVRYRSDRLFPEYRPAVSPAFVPILHSNSLSMRSNAIREATMGESELPTSPPHMPIQDTVMAEIKPPMSLTHKAIHKASSMAEIESPISRPHKVASHEAAMAETEPPMSQLLKKEDLSGDTEMIHNSSRRPVSTKTGSHCEVTNIPQWNGAPMGTKTLCNVHSATETPVVPKKCSHCAVTETPQWREGPMGRKTLCNACGVRYRSGRLLPEYRPAASPTFVPSLHSNSHREVVQIRRNKVTDEAEPPMSPPHKAIEEAAMVEVEPPMSPPPEFIPMSNYLIDCVLGGSGQY